MNKMKFKTTSKKVLVLEANATGEKLNKHSKKLTIFF